MVSRISLVLIPTLLLTAGTISGMELDIDQPSFKDPYSGQNDALLDIDIHTTCVSNLVVSVHLPQTFDSSEATATLTGPSFGPIPVTGISTHPYAGHETTASLSWDNTTKVLTFSDFIGGGSTASIVDLPGWINLNFDIPDIQFGSIPLTLTPLPPPVGVIVPRLKINLNNNAHFNATANGPRCGDAGPHGDPVFAGFQGQEFQFHGLPDEHFNLVSSPNLQLNAHFVYLSSGTCDYNDTECWTHPGTYMDILGFSIANSHIKVVAGTHDAGLRVWINDMELFRGTRINDFANITASIHYHHKGRLEIQTDIMGFEIANSDMFINMKVSLNNPQLLRAGATKHTITDKHVCKANSETNHHQLVETIVAKKYPVTTPLHGLIGQTWRNVRVWI